MKVKYQIIRMSLPDQDGYIVWGLKVNNEVVATLRSLGKPEQHEFTYIKN